MKTVSLSGSLRKDVGSKDAKGLRKEGRVPCVLYGNGQNIHFHVKMTDFDKLINTPEVFFIEVDVEGDKYQTLIKDVQFHPVTDNALHIDFLAISEEKDVTIKLPVLTEGIAPGVINGGKLRQNYRKITVKGLPSAIPENVTINISELKIGATVRLGDIDIKGVEFIGDMKDVVIAIKMARGAVTDEEGAEATEA